MSLPGCMDKAAYFPPPFFLDGPTQCTFQTLIKGHDLMAPNRGENVQCVLKHVHWQVRLEL